MSESETHKHVIVNFKILYHTEQFQAGRNCGLINDGKSSVCLQHYTFYVKTHHLMFCLLSITPLNV